MCQLRYWLMTTSTLLASAVLPAGHLRAKEISLGQPEQLTAGSDNPDRPIGRRSAPGRLSDLWQRFDFVAHTGPRIRRIPDEHPAYQGGRPVQTRAEHRNFRPVWSWRRYGRRNSLIAARVVSDEFLVSGLIGLGIGGGALGGAIGAVLPHHSTVFQAAKTASRLNQTAAVRGK
jgi:hypothetical protein